MIDNLVKSQKTLISVIPAKAGIQSFQGVVIKMDPRFRGDDDFLRDYHDWLGEQFPKQSIN